MRPRRSMALSERDWSRFLRAGGDLFPNLIHRHLGDPGFRDELFDRLIRAALDQLVRVFLAQSQGQGQVCMGGLVDVHEVRLRSEEHTSELQSRLHLVCRLLLEKKKKTTES